MAANYLSYPRNGSGSPPAPPSAAADKWRAHGLHLVDGRFSAMMYAYMGLRWVEPFPAAHTHLGAEALSVGAPLPFPPAGHDPSRPAYLDAVLETYSGPVEDITYPKGTVLYRIVGDGAYPLSRHWTATRYTDEATMRRELALLSEWNGDKSVEVLTLDAPLDGHVGRAASQYINGPTSGYILRGGAEQIVFDPKRIEALLDAGLASIRVEAL